MELDVNYDFTTDTPNYWDNFWEIDPILGCAGNDPDSKSVMLRLYQQRLWSKPLPNGDNLQLTLGKGSDLFTTNLNKNRDLKFGSVLLNIKYQSVIQLFI